MSGPASALCREGLLCPTQPLPFAGSGWCVRPGLAFRREAPKPQRGMIVSYDGYDAKTGTTYLSNYD